MKPRGRPSCPDRAAARAAGSPRYTGRPCKGCGAGERYTVNGACIACDARRAAARLAAPKRGKSDAGATAAPKRGKSDAGGQGKRGKRAALVAPKRGKRAALVASVIG